MEVDSAHEPTVGIEPLQSQVQWSRGQCIYPIDIMLQSGCQGWVVSGTKDFGWRDCQEAFWPLRDMGESLFIPYKALKKK